MPTLAEALKPFLAHELPQGAEVADVAGPGVEISMPLAQREGDGPSGLLRWLGVRKRGDARRCRFGFRPEVLEPLRASAAGTALDVSGLEHVAYLEHMAAVLASAFEEWLAYEPEARECSLVIGMNRQGDLEVKAAALS